MKTETVIYKMLTENTGVHMCDSGGKNGRHWQKNQKKLKLQKKSLVELEKFVIVSTTLRQISVVLKFKEYKLNKD